MEFKPFKIGKYLLLERLATGGMAEVYRAKASGAGGFEKQLAVKRILPTYSTNDEFRRMFEYEARLSSMLTHANIVQIYDFVKSGETYLLAMEYVDGKNLRQFINKAKKVGAVPSIEFGVYIINEVCKGLEYAHNKKDDLNGRPLNIIHRDMSPQNIMLSYEGAVKIVDFGIAKAKDRVDETRSGVIKGKFGYMSPEQANGEQVDRRTDIFSTGIILFELLTGRRLFSADNDMATLKLIQGCVLPVPSRINPKISSELERILLRSLTKDLESRYQTAGAFHRSLQEFLNKYYPSYTQKEVSEVMQRVFSEEIQQEQKRFEQIYRQSIPFSQGETKEQTNFEEIEDILEGEVTKSEMGEATAVTFPGDEQEHSESSSHHESDDSPSDELISGGATIVEDVSGELLKEESIGELPVSISKSTHHSTDNSDSSVSLTREQMATLPATSKDDSGDGTKAGTASTVLRTKASSSLGKTGESSTIRKEPGNHPVNDEISATPEPDSESESKLDNPTRPSEPTNGTELISGSISIDPHYSKRRRSDPSLEVSESSIMPEVESTNEAKPRAFMSFLMFVLFLGVTGFLYRLYLDHQVPLIIGFFTKSSLRESAASPDESAQKTNEKKSQAPSNSSSSAGVAPTQPLASGDCALQIDSDPVGAQVIVDGILRGVTSTIISAPCNRAVNLTLKLDGYESMSENIVIRERQTKRYKTLRKIPMGALELTLTRNAKVYLNGAFIKDVAAMEKFSLPLKAHQKYQLRFVNEIFGIDTTREFYVEENEVTRKMVELEEPQEVSTRPRQR